MSRRRWLWVGLLAATACRNAGDASFQTRGTTPPVPPTVSTTASTISTSTTTTTTTTTTARAPAPSTSRPPRPSPPVPAGCATPIPLTRGWLFTAEALETTSTGEVWAAGWGHPAVQAEGAAPDPPAVGVTRDGGATWEALCWPDGWPPNGIGRAVALRSRLGIVAGTFEGDPFVVRTTDGGITWQTVTLAGFTRAEGGANCGLADAAVIDDRHIWVVGIGGVYHSDDGGRTFTRQAVPDDGPCAYGRLAFVDPDHVWIAGSGRVLRTTDGGSTWASSVQALPVSIPSVVNDIAFTDTSHGFIATSDSDGAATTAVLLATDDGGQTWRRALETPGIFRSVDFLDHDRGFLAGGTTAHGEIWATTDGGQTWTRRATLDSRDIQVIAFVDAERGYGTISNRPCLIATSDGGRTWTTTPVAGAEPSACTGDP